MTAQVWKQASREPRVTFRCPWCEVVSASAVLGHHDDRRDVWLLVACANPGCGRAALVRVPAAAPWAALDTGADGLLLAAACVLPDPRA